MQKVSGTRKIRDTVQFFSKRYEEIDRAFFFLSQDTDFYDGEFVSEYRTIKTRDQDLFPQVIELDYNLLVLLLAAMADEYANSDMPTYEL